MASTALAAVRNLNNPPTLDRAYARLTVKAVDDDERVITGVATTPSPDRMGDIIEPLGVKFNNPMPLLWQHKHTEPVGEVRFSKPTADGINFVAKLPKFDTPGKLKDRIDEAWQSIKLGLVRAVSIGFRPIEFSFKDDGGIHFLESEVIELSLVTIPAQVDARIETIKAYDIASRAVSGTKRDADGRHQPPIVMGHRQGQPKMRTTSELIAGFEKSRNDKLDRMAAIIAEAGEDGSTLNETQSEEHDNLTREVESIDAHLERLRKQAELNAKRASAINVGDIATVERASAARAVVQVKPVTLAKGMPFVRMVGALATCKGNRFEAAQFAGRWRDTSPEVMNVLRLPIDVIERAAVAPGTTTDPTWAEPLAQYNVMASEFIEYLRPLTIIGRIEGFRRVPFMVKVPRQTAGSAVNWVGETKVKPLSALAFDMVQLGFSKIAGIVPLSEELVRFSSPSAEALVREDLAKAVVQFMDSEFVDPAKAAVANVSPASITNGVTPVPASGTTADNFRADARALFESMLTANMQISTGVWIMKQSRALSLGMMVNALSQPEFPGLTMNGGTLLGFPVVTSEAVHDTVGGSPPTGGDNIIFAMAGEIMLADDGSVTIDMSREASLQMDSAPTDPPTATTVMVSLWQQNLVAIKAERFINWLKRRPTAVGYISGAKYA